MDQLLTLRKEYNTLESQIREAQAQRNYKLSSKLNKQQLAVGAAIQGLYDSNPELLRAQIDQYLAK